MRGRLRQFHVSRCAARLVIAASEQRPAVAGLEDRLPLEVAEQQQRARC